MRLRVDGDGIYMIGWVIDGWYDRNGIYSPCCLTEWMERGHGCRCTVLYCTRKECSNLYTSMEEVLFRYWRHIILLAIIEQVTNTSLRWHFCFEIVHKSCWSSRCERDLKILS